MLGLALAPGLWWREPLPDGEKTDNLWFRRLPVETSGSDGLGLTLADAWVLTSDDRRFFGYSALVVSAEGRLRAYSDSSRWLEFDRPDRPSDGPPEFGGAPGYQAIGHNDLESATFDPASGLTWLGFEHINTLRRTGPGPEEATSVRPSAMADFRENGGAESLVRLADGRFVVLAESAQWHHPRRRAGLLFANDPVIDARSTSFIFMPPAGSNPTDAASLPDGRVLILTRALSAGSWPPFRSKLLVADSADLRAGETWEWRELADLSDLVPPENYEGLAVETRPGGFALWLISDANRSALLQRTILVKLLWDGRTPDQASAVRD